MTSRIQQISRIHNFRTSPRFQLQKEETLDELLAKAAKQIKERVKAKGAPPSITFASVHELEKLIAHGAANFPKDLAKDKLAAINDALDKNDPAALREIMKGYLQYEDFDAADRKKVYAFIDAYELNENDKAFFSSERAKIEEKKNIAAKKGGSL